MFTLTKEFRFEAAHKLPNHDGKCARLHGHSWVLRVQYRSQEIVQEGAKAGMAVDFSDVKAAVQPTVEQFLDHHYLNDTLVLANPTSEAVAVWVFENLPHKVGLARLYAVEVDETCTSSCRFCPAEGIDL